MGHGPKKLTEVSTHFLNECEPRSPVLSLLGTVLEAVNAITARTAEQAEAKAPPSLHRFNSQGLGRGG